MQKILLAGSVLLLVLPAVGVCRGTGESSPRENADAGAECLTGNVEAGEPVAGKYAVFRTALTVSGYPSDDAPKDPWQPFDAATVLTDGKLDSSYEWSDGEFGTLGRDLEIDLGKPYLVTRVDLQCLGKRLHDGWLCVKPVEGDRFVPVRAFGSDAYVDVENNWRRRTGVIRFDQLDIVVRHLRLRITGSHTPRFSELRVWGREPAPGDASDLRRQLLLPYDPTKLTTPAPVAQVPSPDPAKGPIFGDGPGFEFRGVRLIPPVKGSKEFNERLLRALADLKFNVVIHEGLDWAVEFHTWQSGYGGAIDVGGLMAAIRFNRSLGMDTVGSWGIAPSGWVLMLGDPDRVEARPGEAYRTERGRVDFKRYPDEVLYKLGRVNACPRHPENFETFRTVMAELCDIYRSKYFFGQVDEPLQWYNGSRWACCPRCTGHDPVTLMADWVNKCSDVIRKEHGRTHLYQTTIILQEHQGEEPGYPGGPMIPMYKIIDRMPKDNVALINWSGRPWKSAHQTGDSSGLNRYLASKGFQQIIQNVGYSDRCFELCDHIKWHGKDGADFIGATVANYGGQYLDDMARRFKFLDYVVAAMFLWNPDAMEIGSREVAARMVSGVETMREQLDGAKLPSRIAKREDFFQVDLERFYNRGLTDETPFDGRGWMDLGPGMDLRAFPTGKQTLGGIPFSLSEPGGNRGVSCVMVENTHRADKTLPDVVSDIPIGRKAASLVFLHALTDRAERSDTASAFIYRVNYKGGLSVDFPVRYRVEAMEWLDQSGEGVEDLRIGWFLYGARPAWLGATGSGQRCIVYAAEWINPYPQFEVESVDFLVPSSSRASAAALFAVTGIGPTPEMIANAIPKAKDGKFKFTTKDKPIALMGSARGDRTEGTMTILLPATALKARKAELAVTINDWDNLGEGRILFNGTELSLRASGGYNGVDHTFTVDIPVETLKTGMTPNVVKAVWLSTPGFAVKDAAIIVTPEE